MPLLHDRFPALRGSLPHLQLGERPTPVRALEGLSAEGRAPVWLKDDGAFGSGPWGGNKVRKLEWLLPEARRRGASTLVTVGGLGTNWGLAAALYGREQGLRTVLALVDQPMDEHVRRQLERLRASGASLHFTHGKARTIAALPWLLLRNTGRRPPYVLPAGGSTAVGVLGYVEAAFEIADQVAGGTLPEPSHLVVPMGSAGTAAGLALGFRLAGLHTRVVGVPVTHQLRLDPRSTAKLARRAAALLRRRGAGLPADAPPEDDLTVLDGWIGAGYGHPTAAGEAATAAVRDGDGLALDPVYTAKAVAALRAENRAGRFGDGPVLYLHTDGPRPAARAGY
ncbi:MAG TPA: pyridoxal-phosphate dependent enzyme [Thermoleophilaceae bacterium]|nr:pyridoxal-phosphate dependent enzyme [Thermoleophilaceae bacterium]